MICEESSVEAPLTQNTSYVTLRIWSMLEFKLAMNGPALYTGITTERSSGTRAAV